MSQQNVDYTITVFPHIKKPTVILKNLARCVWEILTSGQLKNNGINQDIQHLYTFSFFENKKYSEEEIGNIKMIVEKINKYRISDDELILFLFQHTVQTPRYKFTEAEIKIIKELVKNPRITNKALAKRCNLSEIWVSRAKNKLLTKNVITPLLAPDPHRFCFVHKMVVFLMMQDKKDLLISLLSKIPFVLYLDISTTLQHEMDSCAALLFLPKKLESAVNTWFDELLRDKIIEDYTHFNIHTFGHSVNLNYHNGKWLFDGLRDSLLFLQFLKEHYEVIQNSETFRAIEYQKPIRSIVSQEERVILEYLIKNPYQSLFKLQRFLTMQDIKISKQKLRTLRENILKKGLLYLKIYHTNLNYKISTFLWSPFIDKKKLKLLTSYFSNFPQSDIYISSEGVYSTLEFPIEAYREVKFALSKLQEDFDDFTVFDPVYRVRIHPIDKIVHFWNLTQKKSKIHKDIPLKSLQKSN